MRLALILFLSFIFSACDTEPEIGIDTVLAASHPQEFLGKRLKSYNNEGMRHTLFYKLKKPSVWLDKAGKDVKNIMLWMTKYEQRLPKQELFFRIYEPLSADYDDKKLSLIYSFEVIKKTDWSSLTPDQALRRGKLFEYDRNDKRLTDLLRIMGFQIF